MIRMLTGMAVGVILSMFAHGDFSKDTRRAGSGTAHSSGYRRKAHKLATQTERVS